MAIPSSIIRRKARAMQSAPSPRPFAPADRDSVKPRPRRSLNEAAHKLYR